MDNINEKDDIFRVIHKTEGKSKNKLSAVLIETSTKGLIYRTDVFLDGHIIDAKEINCQDIANADDNQVIFRERYMATHSSFEELYLAKRDFRKVLSDEGKHIEEDGLCVITTYTYENIVKHEVYLDTDEIDGIEFEIDEDLAKNEKVFKAKYTQSHKELVEKYIKVDKFPTNTFLNPIIKKFPLYKKNPMYSLYLFLITVGLVLWILSLILCGKAIVKIIKKVGGKEAAFVMKDLQKSMCSKDEKLKPKEVLNQDDINNMYLIPYIILPEKISFNSAKQIKPIYIKNNLETDLIVRLRERLITDFKDPLVTPDMIVNIISPSTIHIKPKDMGIFEFKLDEQFIKSASLFGTEYKGNLVFDLIDVNSKDSKPIAVEFDFLIENSVVE